jgi:SAM-dependent methyltransferase
VSEQHSNDKAGRRDALERWAGEQLGAPPPARLRGRVARRVIGAERLAGGLLRASQMRDSFAGRLLDRGLDTTTNVHLPVQRSTIAFPMWRRPGMCCPRALRYLGVSERDTFVDFGCGKGRVVHQAAKWPFGRVIGVEVSPELAAMARRVLAARSRQHRCREVEVVVSDVRHYRVPDDVTIGYFFRPFGDETLEAVLRRIIESIDRRPRSVRLIYMWPMTSRSTIRETGRFRVLKEQSSSFRRHTDRVAIFESV